MLRPYDFYPNPLDFVTRRVVLRFLPRTCPMDDVRLDSDLPQEEELALATMGAPSFFNCIYFPKRMTSVFAQDVLFAGADKSLSIWRGFAITWRNCQRLTCRRLLLKNPAHSARIPLLLALFPGAKFIHIHREPSAVFHSMRNFYHRMLPILALQGYRPADIDGLILWAYPS